MPRKIWSALACLYALGAAAGGCAQQETAPTAQPMVLQAVQPITAESGAETLCTYSEEEGVLYTYTTAGALVEEAPLETVSLALRASTEELYYNDGSCIKKRTPQGESATVAQADDGFFTLTEQSLFFNRDGALVRLVLASGEEREILNYPLASAYVYQKSIFYTRADGEPGLFEYNLKTAVGRTLAVETPQRIVGEFRNKLLYYTADEIPALCAFDLTAGTTDEIELPAKDVSIAGEELIYLDGAGRIMGAKLDGSADRVVCEETALRFSVYEGEAYFENEDGAVRICDLKTGRVRDFESTLEGTVVPLVQGAESPQNAAETVK